ncbi:hypothetical protein ACA910_001489 [Epithemia clementina (nom. ined.)]
MNDPLFVETHSSEARKTTPLPIVAIAQHVAQATEMWFPTNTMELFIPVHRISGAPLNPHYHSVVGQSLFLVNWQSQFPGLAIPCPSGACGGEFKADKTNISKNKKLFLMFRLTGPPLWCIIMSYKCNACKLRYNGNDGNGLKYLWDFVQSAYAIEPKYAATGLTSHINRDCSHMMEALMVTNGSGDILPRLIYSRINIEYFCRFTEYLSYWCFYQASGINIKVLTPRVHQPTPSWMENTSQRTYYLQDLFDTAVTSNRTAYGIRNQDQCIWEIQSIGTSSMFAQDHKMEVAKIYQKG